MEIKNTLFHISSLCSILWLLGTAFTRNPWPSELPFSISVSEAIFIPWVLFSLPLIFSKENIRQFLRITYPIVFFLFFLLIHSCILIPQSILSSELIKLIYLYMVSYLFYIHCPFFLTRLKYWPHVLTLFILLNILPGLYGFFKAYIGQPTDLAFDFLNIYPIIGPYGRPIGFHPTPTMLFNNLVLPSLIFFFYPKEKISRPLRFIKYLLVFFLLLSLNKHLFTLIVVGIIIGKTPLLIQKFKWGIVFFLLCFQQFNTYLTPSFSDVAVVDERINIGGAPNCIDSPVFKIGDLKFYPTFYYAMRNNQWAYLKEQGHIGIGSNQYYQKSLQQAQSANSTCFQTIYSDPHSLWLGYYLELGLIGLLLLLLMFYTFFQQTKTISNYPNIRKIIFGFLLYISIAGLITDLLTFRPLWFVIGVLSFLSKKR